MYKLKNNVWITKQIYNKHVLIVASGLLIGCLLLTLIQYSKKTKVTTAPIAHAAENTFYVSPQGAGKDGLSWQTAWKELNQINWGKISPGATILIDGGTTGTTYKTTLTVEKSGTKDHPIIIKKATQSGHNGKISHFGGRKSLLPYCRQKESTYDKAIEFGPLGEGIRIGKDTAWVTIDGGSWEGWDIFGFDQIGVKFFPEGSANNIILRNLEIHDNGFITNKNGPGNYQAGKEAEIIQTGEIRSDGNGMKLTGEYIVLDQLHIHDNGQDGIESTTNGKINNLTIKRSIIENTRKHTTDKFYNGKNIYKGSNGDYLAYNEPCAHTDGIEIYTGGAQKNVVIEDSIFGPLFRQGIIVVNDAWYSNFKIVNSLFYGPTNGASLYFRKSGTTNYTIDHSTFVNTTGWVNIALLGSNHTINNSIIYGSKLELGSSIASNNNCQFYTTTNPQMLNGKTIDPLFKNRERGDFSLKDISSCKNIGSSITSVDQLIKLNTASNTSPQPTPSDTHNISPPPRSTNTPSPSPATINIDVKNGIILKPFVINNSGITHTIDSSTITDGGKAYYTFSINKTGTYMVRAKVKGQYGGGSNSYFVNIDNVPESPENIWDFVPSSTFVWQNISWRGKGSADKDEIVPKKFDLCTGQHQLVLVGRESNTSIESIEITYANELQNNPCEKKSIQTSLNNAIITPPFSRIIDYIQYTQDTSKITDFSKSGKITVPMTVPESGRYLLKAEVSSGQDADGSNSLYIDINKDPTADKIWHFAPTNKQFNWIPMVWNKQNKPYQEFEICQKNVTINIRGREENVKIKNVSLEKVGALDIQKCL